MSHGSLSASTEENLHEFSITGRPVDGVFQLQQFSQPAQPQILLQQGQLLSTISNRYWKSNLSKARAKKSIVGRSQPSSPRSRVMWHSWKGDSAEAVCVLVIALKENAQEEQTENTATCTTESTFQQSNIDIDTPTIAQSKNKSTNKHLVSQESRATSQNMGTVTKDVVVYKAYRSHMVREGILHYRLKSPAKDILVLNDVDSETGNFKPTQYIHLTCERQGTDTHFSCECTTFSVLQEEPGNKYCCHVLFYQNDIAPVVETYDKGVIIHSPSPLEHLVLKGVQSSNYDICLLSEVQRPTSVKYSVMCNDKPAFVHIFEDPSSKTRLIKCMSGYCQRIVYKSSIKSLKSMESSATCCHVQTLRNDEGVWEHLVRLAEVCDNDPQVNSEEKQVRIFPSWAVSDLGFCSFAVYQSGRSHSSNLT